MSGSPGDLRDEQPHEAQTRGALVAGLQSKLAKLAVMCGIKPMSQRPRAAMHTAAQIMASDVQVMEQGST